MNGGKKTWHSPQLVGYEDRDLKVDAEVQYVQVKFARGTSKHILGFQR